MAISYGYYDAVNDFRKGYNGGRKDSYNENWRAEVINRKNLNPLYHDHYNYLLGYEIAMMVARTIQGFDDALSNGSTTPEEYLVAVGLVNDQADKLLKFIAESSQFCDSAVPGYILHFDKGTQSQDAICYMPVWSPDLNNIYTMMIWDWNLYVTKQKQTIPVNMTPRVNTAYNYDAIADIWCPIVLDLDGDGIETTAVNGGSVMFDYNADGRRSGTGWISADDGFLVFDRNGDNIIPNSNMDIVNRF